jgi:response regulator RpfG family c-di-GMP phosphodiesterase/tRNA A-37 threonylcarbamoyl transferase component Bud32
MLGVTIAKESPGRNLGNDRTEHSMDLGTAEFPNLHRQKLALGPRAFLDQLLQLQLLSPSAVDAFLTQSAAHLGDYTSPELLGCALVQAGLLTDYQLDRVQAGTTHGLVMGNYRVLDRLGSGAMGVVFLAEHLIMKRRVAIKVLPVDDDCPAAILERFYAETRVLADLHHPNIVMAFDAGHLPPAGPEMPPLLYLVMELISGGDLEQYVAEHGPVPIGTACNWIRQAAAGLQEAHDHHLIHRDIKPSNLLLDRQGQIKLVDFGLVRQFSSRLTEPRALLGTLEFMAPEQSCDASVVDGRADIYGLGATLFGLLTGEPPYPAARSVGEALRNLQEAKPRRLRSLRPDAPEELDALIDRMLQRDSTRRPALPITVINALMPFTGFAEAPDLNAVGQLDSAGAALASTSSTAVAGPRCQKRVLLVDDESPIRTLARAILEQLGCLCDEADNGTKALEVLRREVYDLLLLDLSLPDLDGYEVCRRLRERPELAHLKIIVVSGRGDHDQLAESLPRGADDYIPKPFGIRQLEAKVQHALHLKEAQDRAASLARQLYVVNRQLEKSLTARSSDVRQAEDALLFAMAKMAESRDGETPGHLRRLQRYTHCLAEHVADLPGWRGLLNSAFLEQLERCVPLHDIGKIGLPESILLKPGKLTDTERTLMETHTVIGDRILEALAQEHGESLAFLGVAAAIVRHHHERFDGRGYPDRLSGDAIPAAARLVAVADVYDALRRQRFHKPALSHEEASRIIRAESVGQFDPSLVQAFVDCESQFERIYRDIRT